ncbi:MAG: PRC-barrel domain containing protein [Intrasporangium sp.]|uniref:PRC-barrel domain containing protein n=1 Tax=Intrasporangium sp. TaxID=1925024 RepID=UPI003F801F28
MSSWDPWNYRQSIDMTDRTGGLTGFKVHATDGDIGKVDEATTEVGASYLVVDTGPWIFGHKVMLPAGIIDRVNWDEKEVWVDRTKDQIKDSPKYDADKGGSDLTYRESLNSYYRDTYGDSTLEP